jgi:hypothetical protein
MQYYSTDTAEVWHIRFVNGVIEGPFEEEIQKPEIYFKMNSDTFCDIVHRRITGLKAFRQGKVKLKATPAELLKLNRLDG